MDGEATHQGEAERQHSCQTNKNVIRCQLSGCPQCVHTLLGWIMNNPLHLINKWSESIRQGRRGEGVKKVECSVPRQQPAIVSLLRDDGREHKKREHKQNRRWIIDSRRKERARRKGRVGRCLSWTERGAIGWRWVRFTLPVLRMVRMVWQPACVCANRIGMPLQEQRNQHQLPLIQKAQASLSASFVSTGAALTARRKHPSDSQGRC